MATKKPAARRHAAPKLSAQDAFTGLSGGWKNWSQFGVSGIVAGVMVYSVTVMIPGMMEKHATALKEAREQGFAHGEKAVEKLTGSMDRLGDKFGSVQNVTQSKQDKIIDGIESTNRILSGQFPTTPASPFRPFPPPSPRLAE